MDLFRWLPILSIFFAPACITKKSSCSSNRPVVVRYAPLSHSWAYGLTKPPTSCPPTLLESNDLPQQSLGSTSSNTSAHFVLFGSLVLSCAHVHRASPSSLSTLMLPRQQRWVPRHSHPPVMLNRSAHNGSFLGAPCQNFVFSVQARLLTLHVRYIWPTTWQLDHGLRPFLLANALSFVGGSTCCQLGSSLPLLVGSAPPRTCPVAPIRSLWHVQSAPSLFRDASARTSGDQDPRVATHRPTAGLSRPFTSSRPPIRFLSVTSAPTSRMTRRARPFLLPASSLARPFLRCLRSHLWGSKSPRRNPPPHCWAIQVSSSASSLRPPHLPNNGGLRFNFYVRLMFFHL